MSLKNVKSFLNRSNAYIKHMWQMYFCAEISGHFPCLTVFWSRPGKVVKTRKCPFLHKNGFYRVIDNEKNYLGLFFNFLQNGWDILIIGWDPKTILYTGLAGRVDCSCSQSSSGFASIKMFSVVWGAGDGLGWVGPNWRAQAGTRGVDPAACHPSIHNPPYDNPSIWQCQTSFLSCLHKEGGRERGAKGKRELLEI